MKPLTKKQRLVLDAIRRHVRTGRNPSLDELRIDIKAASLNSISRFLDILEERGYIHPRDGKARAIKLREKTKGGEMMIRAYLVGGRCKFVDEALWKASPIPPDIFLQRPDFLIQAVRAAIYKKKGMRYKDLLAVKAQEDYKPGEVVAANIGNKVWVGTGRKKGPTQFISTDHSVIPIGAEDSVLGIVVGVVRLEVTRKQ